MTHHLRVLGPPELLGPDGTPISIALGKPLGLLVTLACHRKGQSREQLASLLWPDLPRAKSRHSVRQAIWVLKNVLGENLLEGDDPLTLIDNALTTDVAEFRVALTEGRIGDARSLWRGPFLDGFALPGLRLWDRWVEDVRADLERRFQKSLLQAAEASLQRGDLEEALTELGAAIEVNPCVERAHEIRIGILIDLLQFDAAREALADAHGVVPDEPSVQDELRCLENRLADATRRKRTTSEEGGGIHLEFVGRSRELAALRGYLEDTGAGRCQVVVITGPAGIGKTRLGEEFTQGAPEEDSRAVVVRGTRTEMKLRWGATANMVRQLLLLPGSAGVSPTSDSLLRAMIPSLGRDEVTLQTINSVSPAAFLDAITDLLDAVSYETPLVVLLDDFQWFDRDSRTLLLSLMARGSESRTLILVLGRPDLSSRSWKELEETLVREHTAPLITLRPLQLEEVGELLGLMVAFPDQEGADRVTRQIHEVSGGDPLFIKGLVQELCDQGVIKKGGDGWEADTQELPLQFTFPETIKALLAERLARLSDTASTVAAALAAHGRSADPKELQDHSLLDEQTVTQGISELLERDVVNWTEDDRLDFSHCLFGKAAAEHLPPLPSAPLTSTWTRRRKSLLGIAAGIALALPLGLLWGSGFFSERAVPDPLPFGGGTLALIRQELDPVGLRVTRGPPSSWVSTDVLGSIPPRIRQLFRGPEGRLIFFGVDDNPAGPDVVRVLPDGTRIPVIGGPGDQMLFDLSPDGTRLLLGSENLQTANFDRNIYEMPVEGGEARLLYAGYGAVGPARWSQDGDLIAFKIPAAQDTLALMSHQGERIASMIFGELVNLIWCGPSLILVTRSEGEQSLLRVQVPEMTLDTLENNNILFAPGLTCSPDGSALVFLDIRNGSLTGVIRDLETGEVLPLWTEVFEESQLQWIPDHVQTIPLRVDIPESRVRVGWGQRRGLSASLIFSDGSRTMEGIRWESLDPSIATVDANHLLTGNRVGSTRVRASWGYSLSDTLQVEVADSGPGGAFLKDQFSTLDTLTWIPVGETPFVASRDGENVLIIPGDEKYTDGLVYRDPIPLEQGITIEFEFRIELTRDVHQSIELCLRDTDLPESEMDAEALYAVGQNICFRYPAREFEKLDPTEFSLKLQPGVESLFHLPETPSGHDWIHAGIQLRADGEVSLVVNREKVAVSPIRIRTQPRAEWVLVLGGKAVETELQLRNLTIWREPRY